MIAGTSRAKPLVFLRYAALVLIATVLLLPVYWLLMSSLRPADQIFRHAGTFGLETLVPLQLTLENFRFIFSGTFPRALFNSLFIGVATVTLAYSSIRWLASPSPCSIFRTSARSSPSCCCRS